MNTHRYAMALAAVVITIASLAAPLRAGAEPVRVLIDRSHEWMFAHDDLSRMLRPAGFTS
jgi:hypothetical protein